MEQEKYYYILIILAVIVGLLLGAVIGVYFSLRFWKKTEPTEITSLETNAFNWPVASIAKKVRPSIVSIRAENGQSFHPNIPTPSAGSGIVFRTDGYIVTNYHVVQGAKKIWVTLENGFELPAKVEGHDFETDLVLLKIKKESLTAIALGSEKNVSAGDLVVAIGNPIDLKGTITVGIVSAKNRTISLPGRTMVNLIQTDAPINPGNSGGPLLDSRGRLIGINTLVESEMVQGIGFAIPVGTVKEVIGKLLEGKEISHAYAGILLDDVNASLAEEKKLKVNYGAIVTSVSPETPAYDAGVKEGDVVIAINGKRVFDSGELIAEIRNREVGARVTLTIVRGKKELKVSFNLAAKPKVEE